MAIDCAATGPASLVNCADYTPFELLLFCFGCWLWVVCYVVIIRDVRRYKFVGMPAFAGAGNIGWEFVWTFLFATNMGLIADWAYKAWFVIDVYIFWKLVQYGDKQGWAPAIRRVYKPMILGGAAFLGLLYYFFRTSGHQDYEIGAATAYIDNCLMSVLYLFMLSRLTDVRGLAPSIAWMKMIGTGTNTVFMILRFPQDRFIHALGIGLFVCDVIYIVWLRQKREAQRRGIPGIPALDSREPVLAPEDAISAAAAA
jgi:hypothetical protein